MSAFFSLMRVLLQETQRQQYSLEECFACFQRLVLQHSVHRPPFSVEIFSQEDVENITSYVLSTFFRHYKLYSYVFLHKQEVDFYRQFMDLVEAPVPFAPLSQAVRRLCLSCPLHLLEE